MHQADLAALERLQQLRASGALTDEEFQREKQRVLGLAESKPNEDRASEPPGDEPHGWTGFVSPGQADARGNPSDLRAVAPRWGRALQSALIVALVLMVGLVAQQRLSGREELATEAVHTVSVTGVANIRSQPTSKGSTVLGQLAAGQAVAGVWREGAEGSRWLELAEGPHKGAFVWGRNLVAQGSTAQAKGIATSDAAPAPVSYALPDWIGWLSFALLAGGAFALWRRNELLHEWGVQVVRPAVVALVAGVSSCAVALNMRADRVVLEEERERVAHALEKEEKKRLAAAKKVEAEQAIRAIQAERARDMGVSLSQYEAADQKHGDAHAHCMAGVRSLSPYTSKVKWFSDPHTWTTDGQTVTVTGNAIVLQNAFGAEFRPTYRCRMVLRSEVTTLVSFNGVKMNRMVWPLLPF